MLVVCSCAIKTVQKVNVRDCSGIVISINPLNPKLPFGYIILRFSRKGGTGGGGWGHPQCDMHMVAARLSCQSAMVGTVWANSCPGCITLLSPCRGCISDMEGCLGPE